MPTTFNQPQDGDVIYASQLNQYATAVNALERGAPYWAGDSAGGTTAYTASVTPAITSNTAGTLVNLRMNATNTGASTLAVNGLAALPIRSKNAALGGGELVAGAAYTFLCDGTYWHVIGVAGSGSSNASTAFSSGQVPLARGGTGADLSATGGTGQVLKQSTSGGAITVGALTYTDVGAAASTHTHAASDITSGTLALARGGTGANLSATGGTGQVLKQNTAGGAITVGTLTYTDVGAAAASHTHAASDITSGTIASARLGSGTADATTYLRGDGTWSTVAASDATKLPLAGGTMTGKLNFGADVTIGNEVAIGQVSGALQLASGGGGSIFFRQAGTLSGLLGTIGTVLRASPVAVATGGAWTTIASLASLASQAQGHFIAIVTGMGSIHMDWDGTTLSKLAGASTLVVAGSAGGTEVAFRVSGGNLQASNGTGASKNVSCPLQVFH